MAIAAKTLIEPQYVPGAITTLYTAVTQVEIRAASVTNTGDVDLNISVYVVPTSRVTDRSCAVVYEHRVKPSSADMPYLLPELRGKLIEPGTQLRFISSVAEQAVIHISGIEIFDV